MSNEAKKSLTLQEEAKQEAEEVGKQMSESWRAGYENAFIKGKARKPHISEAVSVLIEALRSDSGYWQSWQANIAVAFQDEFANERPYEPIIDGLIINKISNAAAARFLKNLTHKPANDGQ